MRRGRRRACAGRMWGMSAVTQVLVHGCHDCPFKETLRRQDGGQPTFCRLANFPKLSIDQYVAGTVPAPECALRDDAEIHVRLAAAADVAVAPGCPCAKCQRSIQDRDRLVSV